MKNEFLQFVVKSLDQDGNCEVTLVIKTQSMTDAFDLIQSVKQQCEPETTIEQEKRIIPFDDTVKNGNVALKMLMAWKPSDIDPRSHIRLNTYSKRIVAEISLCKMGGLTIWTWDIQLPTRVERGTAQSLQNAKVVVDDYLKQIGYTLTD